MRVAVIGADGQLGTDICAVLADAGDDVVPVLHADLDIRDAAAVARLFRGARFDSCINTAAMHNVEACEADARTAFDVNAFGPWLLAGAASAAGTHLIHVSTDYVFDGLTAAPYAEADRPNPLNVYGASKLAGEGLVLAAGDVNAAVVRVSGLYGSAPCKAKGDNFVVRLLKWAADGRDLRIVDDEVLSPTWTLDLARQLRVIADQRLPGLLHAVSLGHCSWHAFACAALAACGIERTVAVADSSEFPQKVARPKFSALRNARLQEAGVCIMQDWEASLRDYVVAAGLVV